VLVCRRSGVRATARIPELTRIAFVGIGTMGLPMATNLVRAGHELVACDLDPERLALLGAPSRTTAAEAALGAQLIMLSLPSPEAVEAALFGDQGACTAATPGTIVIDTSTTAPHFARATASRVEALGLRWLDAPVSGGPSAAAKGSLTIMVGGSREVLEDCRAQLEVLGAAIFHVGGPGKGQAAKLCNNAVIGCTMVALAEACETARREGLDARTLYDVLTHATADSRVLRMRYPLPGAAPEHPASRDYEALFSLDLETKDLRLALEFARQQGVAVPIIETALAQFAQAQALGLGQLDYSAVYLATRRT
jgi:3-hydroxyisobutyrate dehydrogenase-like beta-hydroxyacid dehydrogenase